MKKSLLLLLIAAGLAWSCKKTVDQSTATDTTTTTQQNQSVSNNVTTGAFTEVSNTTIGSSGTTLKIAKPGTPVDSVEIAVPANAYTTNPTLKVS